MSGVASFYKLRAEQRARARAEARMHAASLARQAEIAAECEAALKLKAQAARAEARRLRAVAMEARTREAWAAFRAADRIADDASYRASAAKISAVEARRDLRIVARRAA